jgi:hypothetical protein
MSSSSLTALEDRMMGFVDVWQIAKLTLSFGGYLRGALPHGGRNEMDPSWDAYIPVGLAPLAVDSVLGNPEGKSRR